jgi:cytochrome P450 family 6
VNFKRKTNSVCEKSLKVRKKQTSFSSSERVKELAMWLLIALVFLSTYLWFKNRFEQFRKLGYPFAPGAIPFGSSDKVGRTEHTCEFLRREYENYKNQGPAFGIFFFAQPKLVPTDPELIKDIFVRKFDIFYNRGLSMSEDADPLSQHLFFKNGKEWKDLRMKLTPMFTSGKIKMMFPRVASNFDRMIEFLKSHVEKTMSLEMKEVFSSISAEIIADVAFGLKVKCLGRPENEFRRMAKIIFQPSGWEHIRWIFMFSFESLAKWFKMGLNKKVVIDFFMELVRSTLTYREKNNVKRNDFFQSMMNIKNEKDGITFNQMASNCFLFLFDG